MYFGLEGNFPFHIIRKIDGIKSSGILEWWMDFIGNWEISRVYGHNDHIEEIRPSMSGNIL